MDTLFLDKPSIGQCEFIDELSEQSLFIDEKSHTSKTLENVESLIKENLSLIKPEIKEVTKVEKKELSFETFLNYFEKIPKEKLSFLKGESGKDGITKTVKEIVNKELEHKTDLHKLIKEEIKQKESIQLESLTFNQFREFFNDLSKEDLEKIRGPRGRKGKDGLSGGAGGQGPKGEKGDSGVGIQSIEYETVTKTSGTNHTLPNSKTYTPSSDGKNMLVFVNGVKQSPNGYDYNEISSTQIAFTYDLTSDEVTYIIFQ